MRSFGDPSFFRLFDLLVFRTNRGLVSSRWRHEGVDFERERHSATGPKHGLTIDIFTLKRDGRRRWSLMVVKEYWWVGAESKPLKSLRWARPITGARGDILSWLKAQEAKVASEHTAESDHDKEMPIEDEDIA
jgi:hypothetical protein